MGIFSIHCIPGYVNNILSYYFTYYFPTGENYKKHGRERTKQSRNAAAFEVVAFRLCSFIIIQEGTSFL